MSEFFIITTGEKWVGYGFRSFHSVVNEMIRSAEREVVMTVYVMSDVSVTNSLKKAIERGVSVEIFVYSPQIAIKPEALQELLKMKKEFRNLVIHNIEDKILHAKVLVVDGRKVLVGSANPTMGGMLKNYELGLLVDNGKIAQNILILLRRLLK
ncbi:hypothetical protein Asulf_01357 [Archaeoglobus sulfaticallidus PM70-1]|uniref:PLD phosphodiesterase domain-containing protein n=2 Tax=Archaeoglobus TaxID=2233 RepID=N0BEA3_9EURY|nr:hypothetical protein Asulf_01357 [Archaeoglobus sulfaticallidus PM70-1]